MDQNLLYYSSRNEARRAKLENATVYFIQYFIDMGDDLSTARNKVSELSTEISQYLYIYILGNTQPLIDAINNSNLPFMDQSAKEKLINDLSNYN